MKPFLLALVMLALLVPSGAARAGGLQLDPGSDALPLIRHIGIEDSGIERDPVLRHVLERFLGDARDNLLVPNGRTVETVLAALARPAPVPPQFIANRSMMAFWGCRAPDCGLKAAVVLDLRENAACVILHRTDLDPAEVVAPAAADARPATATFHAQMLVSGDGRNRRWVLDECRRELVYASQRARPQGYWLERGDVVLRSGPTFRADPGPPKPLDLWDGSDLNQ